MGGSTRFQVASGNPAAQTQTVKWLPCFLHYYSWILSTAGFAVSSQKYDATLTPTASKHSITRYSENYIKGSKPTAIGLLRRSRKHIHTSDGWLCCRWKPAWQWAVVWWWWWGCTYADVEGLSSHSSRVPRCSTVTHPKVLNLTRDLLEDETHSVPFNTWVTFGNAFSIPQSLQTSWQKLHQGRCCTWKHRLLLFILKMFSCYCILYWFPV